jgi:integrase
MSRVFERDGSYWIDFDDARGVRHRKKVAPSKRVATEALNAILNKVAREEWAGIVEDPKISFADFTKIWSDRIMPTLRPKTTVRWLGIVKNHLKPGFKGALRSIEFGAVEKYIAERLEAGATPASVNREVGVLRHILKRAQAWKDSSGSPYLRNYPLAAWKPLQEPSGRTRFLDEDEITRLLAACNESRSAYLAPFVLVALNSGMRRGEILSLTRNSIHWKRRTATLTVTKNGETRIVNLNETALEALRGLPVRLDGKLFPFSDDATVSRAFRRAVERAGIKNFKLHDLRHSFASWMAMSGIQARGLQALLGHRDSRMTMRYSHLSDQYLRAAVDKVQLGASPRSNSPRAQDKSA